MTRASTKGRTRSHLRAEYAGEFAYSITASHVRVYTWRTYSKVSYRMGAGTRTVRSRLSDSLYLPAHRAASRLVLPTPIGPQSANLPLLESLSNVMSRLVALVLTCRAVS